MKQGNAWKEPREWLTAKVPIFGLDVKKEGAFNAARADLAATVGTLTAADAASRPEKFAGDLEKLHDAYQSLERVFE